MCDRAQLKCERPLNKGEGALTPTHALPAPRDPQNRRKPARRARAAASAAPAWEKACAGRDWENSLLHATKSGSRYEKRLKK